VITQHSIIRNQTIVRNGDSVFKAGSGSLDDFLLEAYSFLKIEYPKFYKMDSLSRLGFLAAEVLLKGGVLNEYPPETISLVLSNAHASLDTDIKYARSAKTLGSPALFVYTLPNIVAGEICIRHKIKGENAFFVSDVFDAELLVDYADTIMFPSGPNAQCPPDAHKGDRDERGRVREPVQVPDACIAGWIDVLGEQHDVFLYLIEKNRNSALQHSADEVRKLYQRTTWNN
jgi:hypothetical protein